MLFRSISLLKEMGPSGIDTEFRGLGPDMGGDVSVLRGFLGMVASMLDSHRDFDLAQAYLALFLKVQDHMGYACAHKNTIKRCLGLKTYLKIDLVCVCVC